MVKTDITAHELRAILDYDPKTGIFVWKNRTPDQFKRGAGDCERFNRTLAGKVAGHVAKRDGYIQILHHFAHRLAWLHTFGDWPKDTIDHINGNRNDNRIANLRDVIELANHQNQRRKPVSAIHDLPFGVSLTGNNTKPFKARISIDGKALHLGTFKNSLDAHNAYLKAKRLYHIGCTI